MNELGVRPGGRILLVGGAGMGMLPLGLALDGAGFRIEAWDQSMTAPVRRLYDAAGIPVLDWLDEVEVPDLVIHSSAVGSETEAGQWLAARGWNRMRRGEALAALVADRRLVAVVGSHGKTTTAALVVHLLRGLGADPGYLIGGLPADGSPPGAWGRDPIFVAEVDESDGSINAFAPAATLWLNFDFDHSAHYAEPAALRRTFQELVARTAEVALVPAGEETACRDAAPPPLRIAVIPSAGAPEIPANWPAYNRENAAAAWACLAALKGPPRGAVPSWSAFPGVRRRQAERLALPDGTRVVEDYAHHPREIAAFLGDLRGNLPDARLVVVFQSHRYSRTAAFGAAFADSLGSADRILLLPVYSAGEPWDPAGTNTAILRHFEDRAIAVEAVPGPVEALAWLQSDRAGAPGCTVYAIVGAGDVEQVGRAWAAVLSAGDLPGRITAFLGERLHPRTRITYGEGMDGHTTVRVGGAAAVYAEPWTIEDLRLLLEAAALLGLPVFAMGRGSNLLFSAAGYPGIVIRLGAAPWRKLVLDGTTVIAGPGLRLQELAVRTAAAGLTGFEFAEGIPGSVGGGLRMNAGAMGAWLLDRICWVDTMDPGGRIARIAGADLGAGYRSCPGLENRFVLRAAFTATGREEPERIRERIAEYAARRRASQPSDRSAGCSFKNPDGDAAGRLIEAAGLKGFRIGGAVVSEKHANFVVNDGGATAGEVDAVLRHVETVVFERFGVRLEREVVTPEGRLGWKDEPW